MCRLPFVIPCFFLPCCRAQPKSPVALLLDAVVHTLCVSGDQFLRHLTELFRLLLDFTALGAAERRMLLMNGDLDKLLDFYTSDHAPYFDPRGEKITRASMPSFSLLATVISQLTRSCRLGEDQGGSAAAGPSPFALDGAVIVLPARSFAKLTHKQFTHQVCTEDPDVALSIFKHLMHRNTEMSNLLCTTVRAGLLGATQHRVNSSELRGYFKVLHGILSMTDSLANMRSEWTLPWLVDRVRYVRLLAFSSLLVWLFTVVVVGWLRDVVRRVIQRQGDGDTLFLCLTCRLLLSLTMRNEWARMFMVQRREEWSTWFELFKEERRMSQSQFSPYNYAGYSTTRTSRAPMATATAGAGWFPSV